LLSDKAEKALLAAKQSIAAGNTALAQSDLQALVTRYGETRAGVEGGMLLAQLDYDGGRYNDGIKVLEKVAGERSAAPVRSEIFSLIGDGYAQLKKLGDAARSYEKSAQATNLPNEQAFQRAKAARTFAAAADTADARRLWVVLAADSVESVASEARVRLAELTAKPVGKS
jgi:hypothetical protein